MRQPFEITKKNYNLTWKDFGERCQFLKIFKKVRRIIIFFMFD